ncbi:MAG: ABC-type Zn uptake system ZnuABC Zn-binding protein ZnuA [Maribacter sp.]|jgi:ABC-type Zn uptake system ZnuABC Zn-binding protein ZnuA
MRNLFLIVFCCSVFALQAQDKPAVLATASMISDMASNIFGDKADVQMIVPLGGDPHLFEPTPNAAKKVNEADLILMNGLTFEGWLTELVENSGTKAETVRVTEGLKAITSEVYTNATDPHAWMDVSNAIIYSENILKAAKKLIPNEAAYFDDNFNKYKAELEAVDKYIIEKINSIPEKQRVLITSHDAFQYYGKKYGIQLKSSMGTSTDADVQTSDMIALQKVITETGVPAIFVESTINPKLIEQLAKDNGIVIGGELFADSLGDKESGADTYIKMMKRNTDVITKALNKKNVKVAEKTTGEEGVFDMTTLGIIGLIVVLLVGFFALRKRN